MNNLRPLVMCSSRMLRLFASTIALAITLAIALAFALVFALAICPGNLPWLLTIFAFNLMMQRFARIKELKAQV